ncbi:MAG TPA: ATP-binding protein, partial [Acholeplasmataceae bacterium]|nr:ATP-binding protein [Acholeplasmataceae bacterium]
SGGLKITGLINNSNFLRETKCSDIKDAEKIISEVSKELKLDVIYTGVYEKIANSCDQLLGEIISLKLYLRKEWL